MEKEVKARPARRSKFETMSRNSIDGVVIRNRKSIEIDRIKEGEEKDAKDEDSDGGSSYNIYGSGQQLVISKEVSEQLGLGRSEENKEKEKGKRGKSILKKNSILSKESIPDKSILDRSEDQKDVPAVAKKAKKSVMFTKSRFAEWWLFYLFKQLADLAAAAILISLQHAKFRIKWTERGSEGQKWLLKRVCGCGLDGEVGGVRGCELANLNFVRSGRVRQFQSNNVKHLILL